MSDLAIVNQPAEITTSLRNTDHASMVTMANALNAARSLADYTGDVIATKHIICTAGERASRVSDQPDTPCTNTYLVDSEGNAWFTQSEGIARSAKRILAIFSGDFSEFPEGIVRLQIVEDKLNNGNTLKTLKIVD